MVTGVETAGLIMAAIPLIINGLDHYADGVRTIRKWWRYRRELESLARTLVVETTLFSGTCEKLLNELVIDDDFFIDLIENPGGPLWKDDQLNQKLRQHLGSKYKLYEAFITDMGSAVEELVRKLEIDDEGKPLFANYNDFKPQWKRVKFSIFRRGYDEALTKIRENNTLLERLINQDKELLPERKRRKRSGPRFNEIRGHAANLYRGLARSWTCDCGVSHCTSLRLDARLPGIWASDQGSLAKASEETLVGFKVIFWFETEIASNKNFPWLRQEAEIRVLKHERSIKQLGVCSPIGDAEANAVRQSLGLPPSAKGSSTISSKLKKAVKFTETPSRAVLAAPSSLPEGDLPVQIENLCVAMGETSVTVTCAEHCLGYIDQEDRYRLELYLTCQDQAAHHESTKSLGILLAEQNHGSAPPIAAAGNLPLARGERLGLALTVASSVLQLYDTPWLRQYWSKRDIFVDMTHKTGIFERAFISTTFPSSTSEFPVGNDSFPCRNLTLFCLGIVLIEITLCRTLESMRTDEDPLNAKGEPDMMTDLSIARRALKMGTVSREAGIRYEEVVYRCIWCEFGVLETSLDNDDFRRAVYDGVVAPLEEDMKFFNGFLR